jgi:inhibitor of cysteine peptidase
MFRPVQLTLILILLWLLGSCSSTPTPEILTEKNDGMTVNLKPGDTLVVQLQGNPSTGYTWEPENKNLKILTMVGEPEFISQNKNVVGSAGVITLQFKAVTVGQEPLKLIYHRSWEKDVAPLQTFTVSIVVK